MLTTPGTYLGLVRWKAGFCESPAGVVTYQQPFPTRRTMPLRVGRQ